MTPALRAKLIGQLILLTIGGITLVTIAWLALRAGRRYVQHAGETRYSSGSRTRGSLDDWAKQRIVPRVDDSDDSNNADSN